MLLNRAIEKARMATTARRLLRRRARARPTRAPVVLVPSILGTRLVDERGRAMWGSTRRLYFGAAFTDAPLRSSGLLDGFTVVPGLYRYDVFGGLVRFLEDAGGYTRGEDLHVLDYDWRTGVLEASERLAALIDRLRGAGDERVDLVSVSSAGLIVRAYLLGGAANVRRVVYVGTPQRGSFSALGHLVDGVQPAPRGRLFPGAELVHVQTCFDVLPHPDDRVFVDEGNQPLPHDLYDAATWVGLGIAPCAAVALQPRLDLAKRLHRAIDATPAHDAFIIGARHLPTATRVIVRNGRANMPPCEPRKHDPDDALVFEPGDSGVSVSSLRALPGFDAQRLWWVTPPEHRHLPADPEVQRLSLEALLATDRPMPAGGQVRTLGGSRASARR